MLKEDSICDLTIYDMGNKFIGKSISASLLITISTKVKVFCALMIDEVQIDLNLVRTSFFVKPTVKLQYNTIFTEYLGRLIAAVHRTDRILTSFTISLKLQKKEKKLKY